MRGSFIKQQLLMAAVVLLVASCSSEEKEESVSVETMIYMDLRMQEANRTQVYRGDAFLSDVRAELAGSQGMEMFERKREKLEYVAQKMDEVEKMTDEIFSYVDALKAELLKSAGEDKSLLKTDPRDILRSKLGTNELKNPSAEANLKDAQKLVSKLNKYRDNLIENCANYTLGDRAFHLKKIGNITGATREEVLAKLEKKLNVQTYNYSEDGMVLRDLYLVLHNAAGYVESQKTGTLITNLCLLTTVQQDILNARDWALAHWKIKVSTGEYGFSSIKPIVDGPSVVTSGEKASYSVFFGAIDGYRQPEIEVTSPKNASVVYNNDGTYSISITPETKGVIEVTGTLTLKTKSGIPNTKNWTRTVEVR